MMRLKQQHMWHLMMSTCIFLLTPCLPSKAQTKVGDTTARQLPISISVQPLFLFVNAVKADFEIQPLNHQFAYLISAELYTGQLINDYKTDQLNGFGIGVQQKYKFKQKLSSPYISYGATYRHQEIAIETEGFYPYQYNGFTYYDYGPIKKRLIIDAMLFATTIGYQKVSQHLMFDLYVGLGYKTPVIDLDFQGYRTYNRDITSYAYKGFGILAGFKVGYQMQ